MPGTHTIELVMAFGGTMVGMAAVRSGTAAVAVVAATLAAGGVAAADPCPATALLYGEPALIESGAALLRDRGVSIAGRSGCDAVIAVVARDADGERVRVTITDAGGRSVERVVDDVAAAATTIESWARRDLTAPLLAMRGEPGGEEVGATAAQHDAGATTPAESRRRGFSLAATAALGGSSDGGLWTAAQFHAGIGIGAGFRAGAIVRVADDTEQRGATIAHDSSRWTLDLLAAVDRPFALGRRITLTPGVAIGQTTLRVRRDSPESPALEATELLVLGQVGARVRIAGAWSVGIDLAVDVAPFAPGLVDDPPEDLDDEPQLAGFPRLRGWLGVGLTYGDP